jgi:hypothetical protein
VTTCPVCTSRIGARAYLNLPRSGHVRLVCDTAERYDYGADHTILLNRDEPSEMAELVHWLNSRTSGQTRCFRLSCGRDRHFAAKMSHTGRAHSQSTALSAQNYSMLEI